jgi:hypothetical protein
VAAPGADSITGTGSDERSSSVPNPRVGVAILTMGTRPAELADLLASVAEQDIPAARVAVVGEVSFSSARCQ